MKPFFPAFDYIDVFITPWKSANDLTWNGQIILMGFLVSLSCGLIGTFIVLRKLALMGDAISHSILPGLVAGIIIFQSKAIIPMFIGACFAALLCSFCIEWLQTKTPLKPDASLGLTFTSFFALGVLAVSQIGHNVHIDAECLLYGEIGMIPLLESISIGSISLGPYPIGIMIIITIIITIMLVIFYKQLLVTSFDQTLSISLGFPLKKIHYALMTMLALTIVSAFEAVGVILVVAMLVFPSTTASFFFNRIPAILIFTFPLSIIYSFGGFFLARWMDCSIAGAMVVVALLCFLLGWIISVRMNFFKILTTQN